MQGQEWLQIRCFKNKMKRTGKGGKSFLNVQEAMVSIGRFKSVANLFHQMGFRTDHL